MLLCIAVDYSRNQPPQKWKVGVTSNLGIMKVILFSIVGLCMAVCSTSTSKVEANVPETADGEIISHVTASYTLLCDPSTKNFFYLQTKAGLDLPQRARLASFSKGVVSLYELAEGKTINLELDERIFGIAHMRGTWYEENLLWKNTQGVQAFVDEPDDLINELSCTCIVVGTPTEPEDCDSGGVGSTGCEITDGGRVASANWTNHCQVSCAEGYFSCCNELVANPIPTSRN